MIDERPGEVTSNVDALSEAADRLDRRGARTLVLPIDRIHCYAGNPRHGENPEFQRIKASIRAEGMDQPLLVTQRPGDTDYTLYAGGNTRLQILKELYTETNEERFREAICVYRPWTHETDVLLAHLRENDLRGKLTFLDKALAVQTVGRLLEDEHGAGSLTQERLAETLSDHGYALSQALISKMAYAVERLLPLLPTALRSGMGRPQVERIRQLERAAHAYWLERSVDTEAEFEASFAALCRRYDGAEWDIGNLRRALEAEIAERAEASIHAVNLELERRLSGRQEAGPEADSGPPIEAPTPVGSSTNDADAESQVERAKPTNDENSGSSPTRDAARSDFPGVNEPEAAHDTRLEEGGAETKVDATSTDQEPSDRETQSRPGDLKSLRARAWTLATRLAQRNGLSELVQPLSGKGLGFLLRDVPDPALVDQLDEDTRAQVSMVWWQLAAAAELTVAPLAPLLTELPEESVLRRALEDQDAKLLFSSVWTLDPGHTGFRLWRRLDERSWRDLVDLMETYRAIYQVAESSEDPLWP